MTQHEAIIALFRAHRNRLTLSQLMQPPLGREHSARMSDLRKKGYRFICHYASKANGAGENVYEMFEPIKIVEEPGGQLAIAI